MNSSESPYYFLDMSTEPLTQVPVTTDPERIARNVTDKIISGLASSRTFGKTKIQEQRKQKKPHPLLCMYPLWSVE